MVHTELRQVHPTSSPNKLSRFTGQRRRGHGEEAKYIDDLCQSLLVAVVFYGFGSCMCYFLSLSALALKGSTCLGGFRQGVHGDWYFSLYCPKPVPRVDGQQF